MQNQRSAVVRTATCIPMGIHRVRSSPLNEASAKSASGAKHTIHRMNHSQKRHCTGLTHPIVSLRIQIRAHSSDVPALSGPNLNACIEQIKAKLTSAFPYLKAFLRVISSSGKHNTARQGKTSPHAQICSLTTQPSDSAERRSHHNST